MKSPILTYCIVIPMLGLFAGCQTNPATGRKQFNLISTEKEIALGREAAPQFEKQFDGLVANETLQAYIAGVGTKVAAAAERKINYEFGLLASDIPNAFALPGGKVYVTAGLMRRMGNERQLAAVLGHEIGHINARHIVDQLERNMGAKVLIAIASYATRNSQYAATGKKAAEVAANLATMRFSRKDEYEADRLGIRYMAQAGYNPWGMVELLETLLKMNEKEGGSLAEMFRTHPLTGKRIAEAREIIQGEHTQTSASQPDPRTESFLKMRGLLNSILPAKNP